ncbi:MAG TPA: beta-agarase, partial [Candidatus Hydrogenedentes bacterium]|nr:beta-agarase [Candidatus Hydrogenedentota bacterium]
PDTKENAEALRVHGIALFPPGSELARLVSHPFIDAYGQYIHEDWPGKVHEDAALAQSAAREKEQLQNAPRLPGMDAVCGWADGPQLDGTGWFRVEQVNGRWWFVTPEGRLFLSIGVNCVHYGDSTFIEGRDDWFEGLPDADGSFANFWGRVSGVHSMAEAVGGQGRVFNHYGSNLKRKLGEGYVAAAREMAYDRLRAWGFTTVGNWSDGDVLRQSPMPFTVTGYSGNARALEGSTGYWGKMKDVFDPDFAVNTDASLASLAADYRDNPLVVGFFVDNEMSWSGIAAAALQSPPDQPARKVFIAMLQEQYPDIAAVNAAWATDAADWDALRMPAPPNRQCREDCAAFEYRFGRHYFDVVAGALRRHAPNHLYLGCRFTPIYAPEPVVRACAEVADVVSYNMYSRDIPADRYADFGKPVIFGEFHFGATDRGMFHTGLQAAADQDERAALYAAYIESLALHPTVIGAHWFKYGDQPTTGRTLDGENYNIGLVTIADEPYPELIAAAQDIHQRMYPLRYNAPLP